MAWSNNLFYIAFLGQIFVLSYYLPNRLLARMQHVLATYPPEAYPKLYPRSTEHYKASHRAFKYASRFILALGFLILFAVMFWVDHSTFADHGFISVVWPAAYGVIQFLPLMAIEISEFSHLKQMKKAHASPRRTADLRRRGLTDLVSPALIGTAVLLLAGAILFDLYVHDFAVSLGHDTVQRAIVMIVTNGLLAALGAWHLYGRKLDPHQSADDRAHHISVSLKSFLFVSMALSVFIGVTAADDKYNMEPVEAVIMSIYFQAIALLSLGFSLSSLKVDEINFDVYREDVAAT
ncbi:MAG: hypothetical protein WBN09_12275 [Woeseiaceae bacterium]